MKLIFNHDPCYPWQAHVHICHFNISRRNMQTQRQIYSCMSSVFSMLHGKLEHSLFHKYNWPVRMQWTERLVKTSTLKRPLSIIRYDGKPNTIIYFIAISSCGGRHFYIKWKISVIMKGSTTCIRQDMRNCFNTNHNPAIIEVGLFLLHHHMLRKDKWRLDVIQHS